MYEINDDTHMLVKSTLANPCFAVLRHLTSPVSKLNDVWGYCKRDYCISESIRSSSFCISDLLGGPGLRVMSASCTLSPELEIGNVPTSLALVLVQFGVSS